ncbi:MAG: hypothetical protein NDI69_06470 [Bacteriovoracaceae bacterium]|nr:hypothetical protein [Bacteriovoracaceae bacterium]
MGKFSLWFLKEYAVRDISINQVRNRERELAKFGIWLKRRKLTPKIEDIDLDLIHEYIKSRTTFLSKASSCAIIGALRSTGGFLLRMGFGSESSSLGDRTRLNNTRKISKNYHSNLQKIFEQFFKTKYPHFRALYTAIIWLFYSTRIRKSKLLNLDINC